ncbi:unnamed protein product [Brassica oleracea]
MSASRGGGPDQGPSQPQQRRIMRTQTVGSMRSRKLTGWIPPPVEEVFGSLRLHSYSVLKE